MTKRNLYIDKVIKKFTEEITDCVFLMIQNDETLRQEYEELTPNDMEKHTLNSHLSRRIREAFQLPNTGRCNQLKSDLIGSYERHEVG